MPAPYLATPCCCTVWFTGQRQQQVVLPATRVWTYCPQVVWTDSPHIPSGRYPAATPDVTNACLCLRAVAYPVLTDYDLRASAQLCHASGSGSGLRITPVPPRRFTAPAARLPADAGYSWTMPRLTTRHACAGFGPVAGLFWLYGLTLVLTCCAGTPGLTHCALVTASTVLVSNTALYDAASVATRFTWTITPHARLDPARTFTYSTPRCFVALLLQFWITAYLVAYG